MRLGYWLAVAEVGWWPPASWTCARLASCLFSAPINLSTSILGPACRCSDPFTLGHLQIHASPSSTQRHCQNSAPPPASSSHPKHTSRCQPHEMIMVGDRYLTDIVFGNRHGMLTVRPRPFTSEGEPVTVALVGGCASRA